MSELENKENQNPTATIVDTNVALVIAERDSLKVQLAEEKLLVEDLTKRLKQATDLIEEDSKVALINKIAPKWSGPKDALGTKTVEELQHMDKVLDYARIPAFKSGTPIVSIDRSPEAKLESAFDDFKNKTWGRNK